LKRRWPGGAHGLVAVEGDAAALEKSRGTEQLPRRVAVVGAEEACGAGVGRRGRLQRPLSQLAQHVRQHGTQPPHLAADRRRRRHRVRYRAHRHGRVPHEVAQRHFLGCLVGIARHHL
jgi:hypothetical protein